MNCNENNEKMQEHIFFLYILELKSDKCIKFQYLLMKFEIFPIIVKGYPHLYILWHKLYYCRMQTDGKFT